MLDVNKLALLREVAMHGSITGAAQSLKTSPSNISQRIQKLEADTETKLLRPEGRGIVLTPQAKRLVAYTEEILALLENAESEITRGSETPTGVVHLIAFHTFAIGLLASVAKHLGEIAPGVTLKFTQEDPETAIDELLARRADIIVADEYPGFPIEPRTGLVRENIGKEKIHAFLPVKSDTPHEAVWALEPPGTAAHDWAMSICHAHGFVPEVRFSSPDPFVHRQLLKQGIAAAFLPARLVPGVNLKEIHFESPTKLRMHRELLTLVRRGTDHVASVNACRRAIKMAFAENTVQENPAESL